MQELSAIYIVSNTTHATVSLPELNAQARLCKQASRLSLTAKCQREWGKNVTAAVAVRAELHR